MVDLGLAVAAHGYDLVGNGVQHLNDALGGVIGRQVVTRAMVEQITKQNHAVGVLRLDGGHEALAPVGGTVDVRRNDELHMGSFLRDGFLASMIRGREGRGGWDRHGRGATPDNGQNATVDKYVISK